MKDDLQKVANRRLRASLTDPNYLVLRSRKQIFERWVAELADGLTVLDVGGRHQPYRPLVEPKLRRYVAIDVIPTRLVTVLADGQRLPFASETFDLVISTQVFEYFSRPDLAANEIFRVLKPGGVLFLSVAAFAPRFVDDELWRFTPAGVRAMLTSFTKVDIVPEVRSLGGLVRAFNLGLAWFFTKQKLASWLYGCTLCPTFNIIGLGIEKLALTSNDQFTGNYSVRALKGSPRSMLGPSDPYSPQPANPE